MTNREESVSAEAALDGIHVIRSSFNEQRMDDADTVRHYKSLSQVERTFRTFKSFDLQVRPIHHRFETRACTRSYLAVHARLLRTVAHARRLAPIAVQR